MARTSERRAECQRIARNKGYGAGSAFETCEANRGVFMTCLLCPSPAVQDCLCVPCGAKLWAAEVWIDDPMRGHRFFLRHEKGLRPPSRPEHAARLEAFGVITNLFLARQLKEEFNTKKAARDATNAAFDRKDVS
jgi:hypothetical protein